MGNAQAQQQRGALWTQVRGAAVERARFSRRNIVSCSRNNFVSCRADIFRRGRHEMLCRCCPCQLEPAGRGSKEEHGAEERRAKERRAQEQHCGRHGAGTRQRRCAGECQARFGCRIALQHGEQCSTGSSRARALAVC